MKPTQEFRKIKINSSFNSLKAGQSWLRDPQGLAQGHVGGLWQEISTGSAL